MRAFLGVRVGLVLLLIGFDEGDLEGQLEELIDLRRVGLEFEGLAEAELGAATGSDRLFGNRVFACG